ncbi:hypothetical protein LC609_00165 [Nostoc sp. XA013]|nr:hypothetical protein [Nostoc sp. XA013]
MTEEGFNLIDKAVEAHVANEHRILNVLEQSERELLVVLLRKLLTEGE